MMTLYMNDCLFKGSFDGTGKVHPILCRADGTSIGGYATNGNTYYRNTVAPTEDADHVAPGFEGAPVSEDYVQGVWNQPVTCADGHVWYLQAPSVIYSDWAAANRLGAWDATDALGIPNVFRYAFNRPTGPIADPPLLSISFSTNGNPVIHTPPLVYGEGFDFSILATEDAAGTSNAVDYALAPAGTTAIPDPVPPARFFRLKAAEQP